MQPVHVLGDQEMDAARLLHTRKGYMSIVGVGVTKAWVAVQAARPVSPANSGVTYKVGVVDRGVLGPETVFATIVGDARLVLMPAPVSTTSRLAARQSACKLQSLSSTSSTSRSTFAMRSLYQTLLQNKGKGDLPGKPPPLPKPAHELQIRVVSR